MRSQFRRGQRGKGAGMASRTLESRKTEHPSHGKPRQLGRGRAGAAGRLGGGEGLAWRPPLRLLRRNLVYSAARGVYLPKVQPDFQAVAGVGPPVQGAAKRHRTSPINAIFHYGVWRCQHQMTAATIAVRTVCSPFSPASRSLATAIQTSPNAHPAGAADTAGKKALSRAQKRRAVA